MSLLALATDLVGRLANCQLLQGLADPKARSVQWVVGFLVDAAPRHVPHDTASRIDAVALQRCHGCLHRGVVYSRTTAGLQLKGVARVARVASATSAASE